MSSNKCDLIHMVDTEMERNSLMKDVYPYLRKFCSILGLEFNVVDMRWGVREERRYSLVVFKDPFINI